MMTAEQSRRKRAEQRVLVALSTSAFAFKGEGSDVVSLRFSTPYDQQQFLGAVNYYLDFLDRYGA